MVVQGTHGDLSEDVVGARADINRVAVESLVWHRVEVPVRREGSRQL